ncbi:MAG: thiamine pyrophosphate-binding protein [Alphaproteobacteria bacterium]|nr:thiamine pyrophosphate-binding protein [Alphaproteobacteria bacterium]MDP6563836.1 thiamine pyrophosphate-binding protein [Alphaproteobacteria bacterium]MDP6811727.1 thiamine pyrophosphate-binding protein [Alphaproteobacteria bacterium]
MNQLTGAEAMVRMLQGYGVSHVFGLCGDTSLPFYDALFRLDHDITHILSRDERSAAYMADGYARVSGRVGVCEGPSGGGATYIAPGLIEANESSIPILAITTDISVGGRGRYSLTELDQAAMFRPLTKWNAVIDRAEDLPKLVRTAFREMTTARPGSAHLGLPFDVQKGAVEETEVWQQPDLGRYPAWPTAADPAAVVAAASALEGARNPLIVCGGGVVIAGAEDELGRLAEALGAPVATTISGKGSIAEDHPLAVGVVGSNGGVPETRQFMDGADLVLLIGCRAGSVTTERWRHPAPGAARIVHIDSDPVVIGANYQTEAAVVGDARLALAALNEALSGGGERPVGELNADMVARARAAKFAAFDELAASEERPIRPERVVATLRELLDDDAVVVADPGTPCPYLSAYYPVRRSGRQFVSNRAHGALGYSLPAAVGAYYGRPGAKIVAVMGDGSFGFSNGELETVARLGLPITFVVIANAVFGWIKAGQKSGFDGRYFSVDFAATDHARLAEGYGLRGWRVEDPAELRRSLAAALDCPGPSLVDVVCQPLQEAHAPVSEWVA